MAYNFPAAEHGVVLSVQFEGWRSSSASALLRAWVVILKPFFPRISVATFLAICVALPRATSSYIILQRLLARAVRQFPCSMHLPVQPALPTCFALSSRKRTAMPQRKYFLPDLVRHLRSLSYTHYHVHLACPGLRQL